MSSISLSLSPTHYQYDSSVSHTEKVANEYKKMTEDGNPARFLMYQGLSELMSQYVKGKKALDFGAGTGISSNFLNQIGFSITAVDISDGMLAIAKNDYPEITFKKCEKNKVFEESNSFDLVFSSLVFFELSSKDEIVSYLKEAHRLLNSDGVFIAVTGSEYIYYGKDMVIFNNNYPENENLESGKLVKACLINPDQSIEFTDYYWTKEDYLDCFKEAGFEVLEVHSPLGKETDPYPWKAEKTNSLFTTFVAKPIKSAL